MNKVKRNYKDSVFRRLFENKEAIIELYNALSGRNYSTETDLEIITLENSIFGDMKNDLAFIIDGRFIILIEHQSTVSPNMPFREFIYLAKEYERLFFSADVYSKEKIRLPVPELYVFYNGTEDRPVEEELKLSDSFCCECDTIAIEAIVKVINVNYEKNAELLRSCELLANYSKFIYMIRKRERITRDLQKAMEESIETCIKEGILTEFLKKNGGEIMSILYDALTREECEAIRENDGYVRGLREGEASGEARGEAKEKSSIARKMLKMGMDIKLISEATGLTEEEISSLS